jgi:hypothetical protein
MHMDLTFYTVFIKQIWFQVSGFGCQDRGIRELNPAARMKLHLIQCPLNCDLWLVGAAFACIPLLFKRGSRDLPGQSRLKTAPTINNNKISFSIELAAFQAGGWADTRHLNNMTCCQTKPGKGLSFFRDYAGKKWSLRGSCQCQNWNCKSQTQINWK